MLTINDPATVAAVTTAFEAYERALIANDVPALQAFFWDSPDAIRFGVNEQLYGAEEIAAFRRNRVINFSHRRGLRTTVTTLGTQLGSVMYEYVSKVSGIERQGRQSQTWARLDGEWKIIAAHVSLASQPVADAPDWATYLKAVAAAVQLPIDPAYQAGAVKQLATIAALAEPLLAFPLPAETEPAPVFMP